MGHSIGSSLADGSGSVSHDTESRLLMHSVIWRPQWNWRIYFQGSPVAHHKAGKAADSWCEVSEPFPVDLSTTLLEFLTTWWLDSPRKRPSGPRQKQKWHSWLSLSNHPVTCMVLLVTNTSSESAWEERRHEHEHQEVRTVRVMWEASCHNMPSQSVEVRIDSPFRLQATTHVQIPMVVLQLFHNACLSSGIQPLPSR